MIGDKHLWGHQRTVYRDKSVWVVEIFGRAGGASSLHYHERMVNAIFVESGILILRNDHTGWKRHLSSGGGTCLATMECHQLSFHTDVHAYETYYALPGHEIDENDIVRLSPGRAPDAVRA